VGRTFQASGAIGFVLEHRKRKVSMVAIVVFSDGRFVLLIVKGVVVVVVANGCLR